MATIEHVETVDDMIPIKTVLVTCTNKDGLVSNTSTDGVLEGVPENGLCGFLQEQNPDVLFIATGGTYKLLKGAGLNAIEVAAHTKYPEMKTGLVKSLHPAIHAGILAHKHTASDDEFMQAQGLEYIDAVILNFYPLDDAKADKDASFEMVRQMIDVGGPTMAHNARKAFVSTALITDPSTYPTLIDELKKNKGAISLATRLELSKKASKMITAYMASVDNTLQTTTMQDLTACYTVK